MLVCISGVIGAGKSTLVNNLDGVKFFEPLPETDNFMLEAYYKDPARYAYSMQTLLLSLRFRAQQEAQWRSLRGELCIMDSTIYGDKAFLEVQKQCGYIDDLEYRAYNKLCEIHFGYLQYPDILIHIDLPLEDEVARIKERARGCEAEIDVDYLKKLGDAYKELIPFLARKFPVRVVDGRKSKEDLLEEVKQIIAERRSELANQNSVWPAYKRGF